MSTNRPYILDSDVFIAAKNSYYAFTICPGFWNSLIHHHEAGNIGSIDRVKGELLAGRKTDFMLKDLAIRFEWTVPAGRQEEVS